MTTSYDESQTERELRSALSERAREIHPSSRLGAILEAATEAEPGAARGRWLTGVAVVASAAVVAGAVWAARPDSTPTLPGGPPSTGPTPSDTISPSSSDAPSPSVSPSASTPASPSPPATPSTAPGPAMAVHHGVYEVGRNGGRDNRAGLVRTFWPADVDGTEPAEVQVRSAVGETLRRSQLWGDTVVEEAEVGAERISLRLSGSGDAAPQRRDAELEVWAVVWTAQAALGRGDVPVTITTDGGGLLLGQVPRGTAFTRAATPPDALCDLWVDDPAPGASVGASGPVVVRGQAVAFEANVEWQLRSRDRVVRDGFTTASVGAPGRGAFTVDLGRLDAGTWTLRVFTSSAEDGSPMAERVVTFVVR